MNEHLYHFTSSENFLKIYQSKKFKFEPASKYLHDFNPGDFLLPLIEKEVKSYLREKGISKRSYSKGPQEFRKEIEVITENIYYRIVEKRLRNVSFIACFTNDSLSEHHRKNYSGNQGVCLKFKNSLFQADCERLYGGLVVYDNSLFKTNKVKEFVKGYVKAYGSPVGDDDNHPKLDDALVEAFLKAVILTKPYSKKSDKEFRFFYSSLKRDFPYCNEFNLNLERDLVSILVQDEAVFNSLINNDCLSEEVKRKIIR